MAGRGDYAWREPKKSKKKKEKKPLTPPVLTPAAEVEVVRKRKEREERG